MRIFTPGKARRNESIYFRAKIFTPAVPELTAEVKARRARSDNSSKSSSKNPPRGVNSNDKENITSCPGA
jgi:hypothetical protein